MKTTFKLADALEINRLGFGAMQLTGNGVFGDAVDRPNAIKILQIAVAEGINFFDTSDAYGPHTNETLIADALLPYKEKNIFIATKGGLERPGPGQWVPNGHPEYIRKTIEGSLKRLKIDSIDLWQLHRVDPNIPIEETLEPVVQAVRLGKIKHVGLSEVDVAQIKQAQAVLPIASVQNLYNLSDKKWDSVVDYTQQQSIAFIPWFPLGSGPQKFTGVIHTIAQAHKASQAQIALAWLLKRSDNILLIPGTKSIDHLYDNIGALSINLSDEEFKSL